MFLSVFSTLWLHQKEFEAAMRLLVHVDIDVTCIVVGVLKKIVHSEGGKK